ncbi:suppressor of fused domain protein [Stieleria sp. TO1_6]|uniref:suppressor of fused domain protein n=1 Tax=Stieleria tagensis TaxID=2956795 RepID=UPI00209AEEAE|nr:suppressor of fused domain protein [Stieleria tagensis]MCO8124927.1 suppressor of fused domain protein [Stieleria tagensis]
MLEQWYIKTANGKRGPYSVQQLQKYVDAGALRPNAGVGEGDGRWFPALKLDELSFPAAAEDQLPKPPPVVAPDPAQQALAVQLQERAEQLEIRARQLDQQSHQLQARAAVLESNSSNLDDRQRQIEAAQQQLQQREQQLQELQQQLQQQETQLQNRQQQLAEQESAVAKLQDELQTATSAAAIAKPANWPRTADNAAADNTESAADNQNPASDIPASREEHADLEQQKRDLLQEFAARQESLSKREADLMRREDELTRRELHIVTATSAASANDSRPMDSPSSWKQVLGRNETSADEHSKKPSARAAAPIKIPRPDPGREEHGRDEVPEPGGESAVGEPGSELSIEAARPESTDAGSPLAAERQRIYQQRFGPCERYDQDDDPQWCVDVSVHSPADSRDFTTLVTSGMSDYPISMGDGQRSVRAELLLYVTHADELAIQILRGAAKLPLRKQQSLAIGTTAVLDDLPGVVSAGDQQDCVYLLPVVESDSKPIQSTELDGSSIQLFWLVTISDAERRLIESSGIHKFLALLETHGHSVYFDLNRDCYLKRKGWFRR